MAVESEARGDQSSARFTVEPNSTLTHCCSFSINIPVAIVQDGLCALCVLPTHYPVLH